jgi:hypothetical protein
MFLGGHKFLRATTRLSTSEFAYANNSVEGFEKNEPRGLD